MGENKQVSTISDNTSLESWIENYANSSLCPKHLRGKPTDIASTISMANELNIGRMVAINNIYIISDKVTMSVHLYKALATRGNVTWDVIKSHEPIYQYHDTSGNIYSEEDIKDTELYKAFPFYYNKLPKGFAEDIAPKYAGKILVFRTALPVDFITEINFERVFKNGRVKKHTEVFKYSKAVLAELTTKDNWVRMPSNMCLSRCFTEGIRVIASDVVFGLYETSEVADMNNIKVDTIDVNHEILQAELVEDELQGENN